MKRIVALVAALSVATSAFSSHNSSKRVTIDASGLSEVQQAEIAAQVAKLKQQKTEAEQKAQQVIPEQPKQVAEKLNQWAEFGKNLGSGLVATARELGVAANDFVKTPVGMITAGIIIYRFVGKDLINQSADLFRQILKVTVGSAFLVIGIPLWFYSMRRMLLLESIETRQRKEGDNILTDKTVNYREWGENDIGPIILFVASGIGIIWTGLGTIFF